MTVSHRRKSVEEPARSPAAYRLDRLRIRHVRLLEVIHRRGSLGAAAKELALSQPAVTLMLRELELVFGTTLVERNVRGGKLTQAGLHALERLNAALSSLEHAIEAGQPFAGVPPLRIGCAPVMGMRVLPRALAWMEANSGMVSLRISESETTQLLTELVAGTLDCVVGWVDDSIVAQYPLELLNITPLWTSRLRVFASAKHPLTKASSVPMAALVTASWALPRQGSRAFVAFLRLFAQNGQAPPPVTVEYASIHTGMNIVRATSMITIAPDSVAEHYLQLGTVTALRGDAISLENTHASLISLKENRNLSALVHLKNALLATARDTRDNGRPTRKSHTKNL